MRRVNVPERFLNALPWRAGEHWDVVVVGLPFAGGSLSGSRSSLGPGMLRSVSRIISPRPLAEKAEGWWDYRGQHLLCEGLRIGDAGDLTVDPLHAAADLERLPDVLAALRATCSLLVVLGGDDSLSYWIHRGFEGVLVHVDAHEDGHPVREGAGPHHADFISHLERHSAPYIVQYGMRGMVQGRPQLPGERRTIAVDLRQLDALLVAAPTTDCAVSLDVDVLEPELMRSVTAPVPDGMTTEAVLEAVRAVATSGRRVRQFSVMEFAPHPDSGRADAMRLIHLVLRSLDMWHGGDDRG